MSVPKAVYLVSELRPDGSYGEAKEFNDDLEARAYAEAMSVRTGRTYEVFMVVEMPS